MILYVIYHRKFLIEKKQLRLNFADKTLLVCQTRCNHYNQSIICVKYNGKTDNASFTDKEYWFTSACNRSACVSLLSMHDNR